MRVRRLEITNFRGVSQGTVDFAEHTLLVGGNNVGKSTVCEALDLVLGPERMYRRPVVDEHDFFRGRYLDENNEPVEVSITAVLVDISDEAKRRFHKHLRPWDDAEGKFVDESDAPLENTPPKTMLALPVCFVGRYDRNDDDFVGGTFFDHPIEDLDDEEETELKLGAGRRAFTRDHKRFCGFLFLRTLRTGARALSLQRGSLLDTILRLGGGTTEMWQATLNKLATLTPAIGEVAQLKTVRSEVRQRTSRFVNLTGGDDATAFFASDLTREHLREVVSLFVSTQPAGHLLPFARLGTGSVNMLVFALLTFIAELKEKQNVIFAMEEPEIALPPHTQRRVGRFALEEMGQAIVTSHSPYVIEQFKPEQIVALSRDNDGKLVGKPVQLEGIKLKKFRTQRRQFAEALLARAVLVVEGATEQSLFPEASSVLEKSLGAKRYSHLDLAGVSVFDAGSDSAVPAFGKFFRSLGKPVFGVYDKPSKPQAPDAQQKLAEYDAHWELPFKGVENLLAQETAVEAQRRFLEAVGQRDDYPTDAGKVEDAISDGDVRSLVAKVLIQRKGEAHGYAAMLILHCKTAADLPVTIRTILEKIHSVLEPQKPPARSPTADAADSTEARANENDPPL